MFPGKQDVDLGLANDGLNQTLFIYSFSVVVRNGASPALTADAKVDALHALDADEEEFGPRPFDPDWLLSFVDSSGGETGDGGKATNSPRSLSLNNGTTITTTTRTTITATTVTSTSTMPPRYNISSAGDGTCIGTGLEACPPLSNYFSNEDIQK
eukprot:gene17017-17261_t